MAERWAASAFDGEGARLTGGRWNSRGVPVVYLSSSLSLATLELLVHIDHLQALKRHVYFSVEFSEDLKMKLDLASLPSEWRTPAHWETTQAIGDAWVRSSASLLLEVPSSVIPVESNYLLNPAHVDRNALAIGEAQPFGLDPRLLQGE